MNERVRVIERGGRKKLVELFSLMLKGLHCIHVVLRDTHVQAMFSLFVDLSEENFTEDHYDKGVKPQTSNTYRNRLKNFKSLKILNAILYICH